MFRPYAQRALIPWTMLMTLSVGCDERATQIAREAADRQAAQNASMADLQKEVASGTRALVSADAVARREIVGVHRDLQAKRQQLDGGWNALEAERRQLANARRTESRLLPLFNLLGGLMLIIVLLGFLWQLLVRLPSNDPIAAELSELLLDQLALDELPEPIHDQRIGRDQHRTATLANSLSDQESSSFN